jgi:hypothetical protein
MYFVRASTPLVDEGLQRPFIIRGSRYDLHTREVVPVPIDNIDRLRAQIQERGFDWRVGDVSPNEIRGLGFEPNDPAKDRLALDLGTTLLNNIRAAAEAHAAGAQLGDQALAGTLALRNVQINRADLYSHINLKLGWFDWRNYPGVIGPVQDQRWCGSCVSFATTGLAGAQAGIELGIANLHLSEADQHFCSSHGANCGGWNNHDALDQIRTRGVVPDAVFPYMSAFDNPPQADPAFPDGLWKAHCHATLLRYYQAYRITNFTAHTGTDRQAYLRTVGPMVCGFTVYEDFDYYTGGVYHHVSGNVRGGHAVLVVGYSDFEQAWICRNSWGDGFGGPAHADGTGAGFFKIGYGECNIDSSPFYGCIGVIPPPTIDLRRPTIRESVLPIPVPDPAPIRLEPRNLPGRNG